MGKNPLFHLILGLDLNRLFDQFIELSMEGQVFRPIDFPVTRSKFSYLSNNHFEPAYLGLVDLAEEIDKSDEIELFEGNSMAMVARERTDHYLVPSHIVRSKQGGVKEGASV